MSKHRCVRCRGTFSPLIDNMILDACPLPTSSTMRSWHRQLIQGAAKGGHIGMGRGVPNLDLWLANMVDILRTMPTYLNRYLILTDIGDCCFRKFTSFRSVGAPVSLPKRCGSLNGECPAPWPSQLRAPTHATHLQVAHLPPSTVEPRGCSPL